MKRTIGYFTLIAAVILIGCSASSLFWNAFEGAVDPYQKWTQGIQIVAVIAWEAGAVLAISYCFRHKQRVIGFAGTILLLLAMAYTLSAENRQQAGAQADSVAKTAAETSARDLERALLENAIKRRDHLQGLKRLTEAQEDELLSLHQQISGLKNNWLARTETVHADGIPGAALIARWTGMKLEDSADIDTLIKMAFWTMARVFALPLAVLGISLLGAATLPVQPAKADPVADAAPNEKLVAMWQRYEAVQAEKMATLNAKLDEMKAPPVPRLPLQAPTGIAGRLTGSVSKIEEKYADPMIGPNSQAPLVGSLGKGALHSEVIDRSTKFSSSTSVVENSRNPDGGGGTQSPAPEPVDNSDTQDTDLPAKSVEVKAENVYNFPITRIEEVTKPARLSRPQEFKKNIGEKSQKHREIIEWMMACGTRLPKQLGANDKDAPLSIDAYKSYEKWCEHNGILPAHTKIFSRIVAGELELPKAKALGSKRSKKGRRLDFFRFAMPQEMKKRARA